MKKSDDREKCRLTVVDGSHRTAAVTQIVQEKVLQEYDATVHVGLKTIAINAAIARVDADGERTIEVPQPEELRAAAAITRCLVPIRLRGAEMKAMRKIMNLTLAELARKMDDRTAPETISRWESEAQPMGGYAEKTLRLIVCETLREKASGISYNAKMIVDLKVLDPWRIDPNYEIPIVCLQFLPMKEASGSVVETWSNAA